MNEIGNTMASGNATGPLYTSANQLKKRQNEAEAAQQTSSAVGSINITSAAPTASAQTAPASEGGVTPAYKVEISKEGAQLNASTAANASPAGTTPAGSPSGKAASAAEGASQQTGGSASGVAGSSNESDEEANSGTIDLSTYSEYELRQMLNNGEITPSEYNAEIAKREAKEQAETVNASNAGGTATAEADALR